MTCCMCGKEIIGTGNNPDGAYNLKTRTFEWKKEDRCCDTCNFLVIMSRINKAREEKEGNK